MQGLCSKHPPSSCTAESASVRNPGRDQYPSCHLDPDQDYQRVFFFFKLKVLVVGT